MAATAAAAAVAAAVARATAALQDAAVGKPAVLAAGHAQSAEAGPLAAAEQALAELAATVRGVADAMPSYDLRQAMEVR